MKGWLRTPARRFALATRLVPCILGCGALVSCAPSETEQRIFQDITASAGLGDYVGMTHGAAWGDFDSDGLPDLYVTNHLNDAMLFRNLGGGKFANVTERFLAPEDRKGDKHGAAWADFDNDGRLDLVQLTGAMRGVGFEPKRLLHNLGTRFTDVAGPMGVQNPDGRTRMPLWLDLDGDGRLDLFEGAEGRFDAKTPHFLFIQRAHGFEPADQALPLAGRSVPLCMLAEFTGDDRVDLVCRLVGPGTALQTFDLAKSPAKALALLPQTGFEDLAAADFDNDGRTDLLLARKNAPGAVAFGRPSAQQLVATVAVDAHNVGQPTGFSFRAAGSLSLRVVSPSPGGEALTAEHIHLGAKDVHPATTTFQVGPDIGALAPATPGAQAGVYLGFTAPDRWDVRVTAPRDALAVGKPQVQELQIGIAATSAVTETAAVGETHAEEAPFRLFMNKGSGKFAEESDSRGLNRRLVAGMNVVVGDFDNDMHVDIFVLASGDVGQQENLLLLNDGKGHFNPVKAAGGAAGSPGGVGDSVTMADVDGDGFLDLLVANGGSMGRSLGLPSDGGGYRLYRNLGNGNHWIEIDLEGTRSNRDGIGAVVRITAGGVTQTRLQDGGIHHRGQNHSRLHFGLAKYPQIDKISVRWPSGALQELRAVKADQLLRIKEPAT